MARIFLTVLVMFAFEALAAPDAGTADFETTTVYAHGAASGTAGLSRPVFIKTTVRGKVLGGTPFSAYLQATSRLTTFLGSGTAALNRTTCSLSSPYDVSVTCPSEAFYEWNSIRRCSAGSGGACSDSEDSDLVVCEAKFPQTPLNHANQVFSTDNEYNPSSGEYEVDEDRETIPTSSFTDGTTTTGGWGLDFVTSTQGCKHLLMSEDSTPPPPPFTNPVYLSHQVTQIGNPTETKINYQAHGDTDWIDTYYAPGGSYVYLNTVVSHTTLWVLNYNGPDYEQVYWRACRNSTGCLPISAGFPARYINPPLN